MTFRNLTVKECFDNPKTAAVVNELAPKLKNYPVRLFNKKTCGEIFDLVVSKKIIPIDVARKIEEEINKLL